MRDILICSLVESSTERSNRSQTGTTQRLSESTDNRILFFFGTIDTTIEGVKFVTGGTAIPNCSRQRLLLGT